MTVPLPWLVSRVLAALARVVPAGDRFTWQPEWEAELCWLLSRRPPSSWRVVARRLAAAARHAVWLRWHGRRLEMLFEDVRHALRALWRRPAYTLAAVLTLGVGIGATTAIYSAARAVLWLSLPQPDAEAIVFLSSTTVDAPNAVVPGSTSPPDFHDWRIKSTAFASMAAVADGGFSVTGPGWAERIPGASVTGDFFAVLGVVPTRGRLIHTSDDPVGAPEVAVITDALWQRLFGGDPAIVGRTIIVDGAPHELIGIVPARQAFPLRAQIWTAMRFSEQTLATQRGAHYLSVIARLDDGVTVEQARSDVRRIAAELRAAYPGSNREADASLVGLREALVGDVRPTFWLLLAAVGVLLLVACVNVASLVLTQAIARARDLALRAALGAGRGRLIRAQLVESAVLGVLGCGAGLTIAAAASRAIRGLDDEAIPRLSGTQIDLPVLFFAIAATACATLIVGLWPAWRASAPGSNALGIGGARLTTDRASTRARHVLVAAEIGLAVTLLIGAGLIGRSFLAMVRVDLGFAGEHVRTGFLAMPDAAFTPDRRAAFMDQVLEQLANTPGVEASSAVFGLPLSGFNYHIYGYARDGVRLTDANGSGISVQLRVVAGNYFTAMGIPVREGRPFVDVDRRGQPPVIIVSASAAKLLWPGVSALGRTFTLGTRMGLSGDRVGGTVVGVVDDIRDIGPATPARPTVYLNYRQVPVDEVALVVKGRTEAPSAARLQEVVSSLDPTLPVYRVSTVEHLRATVVAQPRLYLALVALFAGVAIFLAALGIYGVIAQTVNARTREFGIRIALGADRRRVVWLMIRQAALLAGVGIAGGWMLAVAAQSIVAGLLYNTAATDAWTYTGVAGVTLLVAVVSAWWPARRAARIDPAAALRADA